MSTCDTSLNHYNLTAFFRKRSTLSSCICDQWLILITCTSRVWQNDTVWYPNIKIPAVTPKVIRWWLKNYYFFLESLKLILPTDHPRTSNLQAGWSSRVLFGYINWHVSVPVWCTCGVYVSAPSSHLNVVTVAPKKPGKPKCRKQINSLVVVTPILEIQSMFWPFLLSLEQNKRGLAIFLTPLGLLLG